MSATSACSALFRFFDLAAVRRVLLAHTERVLSLEQVGAGLGIVRPDLQRLLVVCNRLSQLALLGERVAPVEVGVGKVRLEAQRLLVVLDRLGQLALLSERSTPVVVGHRVAWLEGHGMAAGSLRRGNLVA